MDHTYKELEQQLLNAREMISKQRKELAVLDIAYAASESANAELRANLLDLLEGSKREANIGMRLMIDMDQYDRLEMLVHRNDGGEYLKDAKRIDQLELDASAQIGGGANTAVIGVVVRSGQTVRQALDAMDGEEVGV